MNTIHTITRSFRYFDWLSFLIITCIAGIGLSCIFSATYTPAAPYSTFFKKQTIGIISGLFFYIVFSLIDYRSAVRWGYILYAGVIGLLIFTLIKGKMGMGAQRWVDLVFFRFQPSELTKLFLPAFITHQLFSQSDVPMYKFKQFIPSLITLCISALLIIKQPDLGTGLLVLFSGLIMLWFAGLSNKFFAWSFLLFIICAPLSWHLLKPYQKKRIMVFMGEGDDAKERYQLEQSKIAIGSGGLLGKGYLRGTQNRLMFLPEGRTDFIFSVLSEEWGFLGALILLILYAALFFRQWLIIARMKNFYAQLNALGLIIHVILSALINIAMVIGLLPIVGIPLPFMSYGISNLWITCASLGWINSIHIHQQYLGQ